jgi:hypothetical protein
MIFNFQYTRVSSGVSSGNTITQEK